MPPMSAEGEGECGNASKAAAPPGLADAAAASGTPQPGAQQAVPALEPKSLAGPEEAGESQGAGQGAAPAAAAALQQLAAAGQLWVSPAQFGAASGQAALLQPCSPDASIGAYYPGAFLPPPAAPGGGPSATAEYSDAQLQQQCQEAALHFPAGQPGQQHAPLDIGQPQAFGFVYPDVAPCAFVDVLGGLLPDGCQGLAPYGAMPQPVSFTCGAVLDYGSWQPAGAEAQAAAALTFSSDPAPAAAQCADGSPAWAGQEPQFCISHRPLPRRQRAPLAAETCAGGPEPGGLASTRSGLQAAHLLDGGWGAEAGGGMGSPMQLAQPMQPLPPAPRIEFDRQFRRVPWRPYTYQARAGWDGASWLRARRAAPA